MYVTNVCHCTGQKNNFLTVLWAAHQSWTDCWLSHSWWCWTCMEQRLPCCSLRSRTIDDDDWCWHHCSVSGRTRTGESTPPPAMLSNDTHDADDIHCYLTIQFVDVLDVAITPCQCMKRKGWSWVRFNVPTKHSIDDIMDQFLWVKWPKQQC